MKLFSIKQNESYLVIEILFIKFKIKSYVLFCLLNISRKLAMVDSKFRVMNTLFYVPNYPIDHIQKIIVNTQNYYEIKILKELDDYIKDNAVILDIGANIGNHSLYWAIERNAKKIYAFEPIRETYDILSKNIEINGLAQRVISHNIACGEGRFNAKIKFFDSYNIGSTELIKDLKGQIIVNSIDNMNLPEEKIDFIKIDTEGFEIGVLKGALGTIKKHKPIIFVESFGKNADSIKEMLFAQGYRLHKIINETNYLFIG